MGRLRKSLEEGQAEATKLPAKKFMPRKPCKCGKCAQCLEDARWDEIFESKFADPDYYTRDPETKRGSPLESL